MREMKDSGIKYLGTIPKEWSCRKIKYSVSEPVTCGVGEEAQDYSENSIRYIRISDFDKNGNIDDAKAAYIPYVKSNGCIINKGDILAATAGGTVGKTLLFQGLNEEACYAGYLAKIRTDEKNMHNRYLLYQLRCNIMTDFREYAVKKSTIENISASAYGNMAVVLPPYQNQIYISNYLDEQCKKIDEIMSDIQKQIDTLEDYKKSVISEAVTRGLNPNVTVKDSGIAFVGKIPAHWELHPVYYYFSEGKIKNTGCIENNLLSLSYGNIIRKDINTSEGLLPASFGTYNIVEKDDIIIRPTDLQNDKRSLRTGLVKEKGIITSAYIDLKPKTNVDSRYFHYLLHSYDVKKVFYNMGNGVRQGLNFDEFSKLSVFNPPIKEQEEIAEYLDNKCDEIDSIIADKKAQLKTIENYKKSLIYEYVTGKKEVPNE